MQAFVQLFEQKTRFLVVVHPEHPWRFIMPEQKSERQRMLAYLKILDGVLRRQEPVVWVGDRVARDELPEGPWEPKLEALRRKTSFLVDGDPEMSDFSSEARDLLKVTRGADLVLCGFYRNLCVAELLKRLKEQGARNVVIDKTLCPNRFIY
jgi:hypothetical protein